MQASFLAKSWIVFMTLHLFFSERKLCLRYNLFRLEKLGTEIIEIKSRDSKNVAANEIEHSLKLAKGCRVFLNKNLWIEVI